MASRRAAAARQVRSTETEAEAPVIRLPDGASAQRTGDALELRDAEGRLLVRYANGAAEICAPAGDLTLSAPAGQVVIRSSTDVAIEAARDITHHAARRVAIAAGEAGAPPQIAVEPAQTRVKAERLEVEARVSHAIVGQATLLARQVVTTAERLAHSVDRYELTATRLVETARDAFRDVADLAESRIGRARTLVKGVYSLHARRSVMVSKEETKVDGKKVLLG
jgi:hypothetical protein